jgi:hypothetical protein
MAFFTLEEATGCTINKCSSYKISGIHQYYIFGIVDDNDYYYEWTDTESATGLTHTQVKTVIRNKLLTTEKVGVPTIPTESNDENIIGDIVGT